MGLLLLIPGLILDLAGAHWFSGAHTVGLILIIAGGALLAFQIVMFIGVIAAFIGTRRP